MMGLLAPVKARWPQSWRKRSPSHTSTPAPCTGPSPWPLSSGRSIWMTHAGHMIRRNPVSLRSPISPSVLWSDRRAIAATNTARGCLNAAGPIHQWHARRVLLRRMCFPAAPLSVVRAVIGSETARGPPLVGLSWKKSCQPTIEMSGFLQDRNVRFKVRCRGLLLWLWRLWVTPWGSYPRLVGKALVGLVHKPSNPQAGAVGRGVV